VHDATPAPLLDARDLRVRYGERWALAGLSFGVRAGEVVGLLGPNGAGKTTTLAVLATLRRPDGGTAAVAGHDIEREPAAARRILGFVPQNLAIYPTLTARENVLFFARAFGLRGAQLGHATESALALVGLEARADEVVATFSGGMQRRLNLACGLLHRPRVLLLDEPTVGVDPQSRERIFVAVRELSRGGTAVLYSTHAMEDAERFCDRVVLIDGGRVVASGTPSALIAESGGGTRLEVTTRGRLPGIWLDGVGGTRPLAASQPEDGGFLACVALDDLTSAASVLERAADRGGGVVDFRLFQPSLQDVFLRLTGHDLRD
jgi:linearmycin/streptolysin S transport system ATP-binding protein